MARTRLDCFCEDFQRIQRLPEAQLVAVTVQNLADLSSFCTRVVDLEMITPQLQGQTRHQVQSALEGVVTLKHCISNLVSVMMETNGSPGSESSEFERPMIRQDPMADVTQVENSPEELIKWARDLAPNLQIKH